MPSPQRFVNRQKAAVSILPHFYFCSCSAYTRVSFRLAGACRTHKGSWIGKKLHSTFFLTFNFCSLCAYTRPLPTKACEQAKFLIPFTTFLILKYDPTLWGGPFAWEKRPLFLTNFFCFFLPQFGQTRHPSREPWA